MNENRRIEIVVFVLFLIVMSFMTGHAHGHSQALKWVRTEFMGEK